MSNTNMQTQTSNSLHNAIMEAGGKDRPPMLAPGNYVQWKSKIKRYIDTKPNNELIHYCLQNPPYKFKWTEKTVLVAEDLQEEAAPAGEQPGPPTPKTTKQLTAKRNQEKLSGLQSNQDIDQTDIDDLYNNLSVYEDEMKRSLSSTYNSQNLDFLSSDNTSSTNEVSPANGNFEVNTAGGTSSSSQVSSTPGADEVVCSFFAQQTTSPPLDNQDLQ
ncbi:hypothetical protein Tco_0825591 [Tanacetum coccineum]